MMDMLNATCSMLIFFVLNCFIVFVVITRKKYSNTYSVISFIIASSSALNSSSFNEVINLVNISILFSGITSASKSMADSNNLIFAAAILRPPHSKDSSPKYFTKILLTLSIVVTFTGKSTNCLPVDT